MSDHTDFQCELLTSLLMRGIQMEEVSKLGVIHHHQNPLESKIHKIYAGFFVCFINRAYCICKLKYLQCCHFH
jgi:hypothetical protein